ncbi:unannotated protein [freshwater metagenome]|uniref:Unannotated protein n=1 Tax=freshwater metagenome TaxID=449393 RepID=A0A6J7ET17_9ZZZZ
MIKMINMYEISPGASAHSLWKASLAPMEGRFAMITNSSPAMRLRHTKAQPCLRPATNVGRAAGSTT